jgi:serine/threonine protein kinase/tetratricopeptide (TPR) repeat protein
MLRPMKTEPKGPSGEEPNPGREEVIFEGARALAPEQRAGYLEKACRSDTQLLQRVQILLRADEQAGDFLETPPAPATTARTMLVSVPVTEKPGDIIGRYKIREKLGEGGWGAVYVADQAEPVRRRVALKIIKLGMDTRSVIARFEAERQALAMMDHPNIARVLDAGTTETGRPFFVMELVRGIKITDYCDQNHLDTHQRLNLFIQVCHAVQHAHQKGIIHRDIKPSNILVTLHDGVPVPKVIDFGIAKATEGRLTDLTVYTELHQFIGTPAYMSPEQAEMSGLDIDTRSDIYSLGVLLYELLTGRTPFDAKELVESGLDQMRRTIREQEPQRPSTRLSTMLHADVTSVAQRHGAEPPGLVRLIRGDLDWIVMKALEKDRTRRFETASGLATDVERFLRSEPVEARPPSSLYRFQKLVRRNKATFAAVGAVTAALVLGFGVSLYLFIQERQALRRAVAAEKQQAALREQAERGLAIEREMHAMVPITEKFTEAGRLLSRGEIDKAEELVAQIPPGIPQGSIMYDTLGDVRARMGRWPAAIKHYSRSVADDPTNHQAYECLAPLLVQTGDLDSYRQLCRRILRQFGQTTDPAVAEPLTQACLLLPPAAADLPAIMKMGAPALGPQTASSPGHSFEFVKGLAEYRLRHFANAATCLQAVVGQEGDAARAGQASMVLAMAQHQLRQTDEARATLAKGIRLADDKGPKPGSPEWNERLTTQILMREAKALIPDASSTNDAGK